MKAIEDGDASDGSGCISTRDARRARGTSRRARSVGTGRRDSRRSKRTNSRAEVGEKGDDVSAACGRALQGRIGREVWVGDRAPVTTRVCSPTTRTRGLRPSRASLVHRLRGSVLSAFGKSTSLEKPIFAKSV